MTAKRAAGANPSRKNLDDPRNRSARNLASFLRKHGVAADETEGKEELRAKYDAWRAGGSKPAAPVAKASPVQDVPRNDGRLSDLSDEELEARGFERRVLIFIHPAKDEPTVVPVNINGRVYRIARENVVPVPLSVVLVLENAVQQVLEYEGEGRNRREYLKPVRRYNYDLRGTVIVQRFKPLEIVEKTDAIPQEIADSRAAVSGRTVLERSAG